MRDIVFAIIMIALIPLILRSARLGTYAWAWVSIMNPHKSTWGFAQSIPAAQLVALATMISFFYSRDRRPFPFTPVTVVYMLLLVWMTFTCLFAINTADVVFQRWIFVLKIHIMMFVTLMLVRGREQIHPLIWVVTLSLALFGVKGGVWTVLTGGGSRVYGPAAGMAAENNSFGLALIMVLPFLYYLYQVSSRRWVRYGLLFALLTVPFAILGSQSRGAFLALIVMATFLGLKGKRPVLTTLLISAGVLAAIVFMPDSWSGRMKTIETFDQDTSAMSRIYTWKTLWALALDRPLVGGGFVVDTPQVFATYAPAGGVGIFTGAPTAYVAHSIYFQMLGEHGFPGLFLYLALGFLAWRRASQVAKEAVKDPEFKTWMPLLMRMCQVSLVGFAVGGAFLSLAHFDLSYYIVSFVVLADATLRERQSARPSSVPVTATASPSIAGSPS